MLEIVNDGAVRTLALNRPDARNALSLGLLKALRAALKEAVDDNVRCLVLTGRGRAFCAGADVMEWSEQEASGGGSGYDWVPQSHALIREMAAFPAPTIALLNGAAVGGGLDLALACDFRFAADSAKFICSYTKVGYSPDLGGTWLLPRLIGIEAAKRFAFTGEAWLAPEALERGMITEMHGAGTLEPATYDFARKLANGPTVAQRQTKRLMDSAETRTLEQQLVEEMAAGKICAATEDHKEGLAAAVERREPKFVGR
ncbi:enoyl-CoA hydratase [Hypericibacter adhaerens]|uniref:Enoyl-CoA hydratase n=1 Tax=Hypericibacter adhaerens TaxID=2602016 RepID=A0A5J6N632_9PROT|nr:enoyl-CoA hydratase-related protein [Hypericibacter adhaerens]QEX22436.1 enoyl-CoA hydratase [Hypericibacter adhaerens]